jgi:hypothetical protein
MKIEFSRDELENFLFTALRKSRWGLADYEAAAIAFGIAALLVDTRQA